jgi:DNA-binding GntR family transcriptional regulator
MLAGTFKLDRSRSAAAQVFDYLRDKIVTLELKPGTALARNDLAEHFQLSLTPIRDALMRLEEQRLVEIFPQHVTRVSAVDIDSARQAQFLRLSLEVEIVRTLAAAPPPGLLNRLHALQAQQKASLERGDVEGFVATDQEFHRHQYEAAGMLDLWHLMRSRSGNLDRLRRMHMPLNGKTQSILHDHGEILAAIEARDPARGERYVREHLSGTLSELTALRAQYPEYIAPVVEPKATWAVEQASA